MNYWSFEELFFLSFIAKKVCTACSGTSYKIVWIKHSDTSKIAVSINMKNWFHKEIIFFWLHFKHTAKLGSGMQTSGLKYQPDTRWMDQPHCGDLGTGTEGKSFWYISFCFVLLMKYLNSTNCHQILDQYVPYNFMFTAFELILHIWGWYYWQYLDVLRMAY